MNQELETPRDIALRISALARMMRIDFDRQVGDLGITRSQWTLIATVARRPGSTQRMIAEMLDMSEASAGRQIDRLVMDGILERRDREDDRRARAVYLTDRAAPLLKAMGELARKREDMLFAGMSAEDLETLRRLLGKIYGNIGQR